jgi:hypothetical protein
VTDAAEAPSTRFDVIPCAAWDGKLAFLLRDHVARRESAFLSLDAVSAAALLIGQGRVQPDSYLGWPLDGPRNLAFPYTPTDVAVPIPDTSTARKADA